VQRNVNGAEDMGRARARYRESAVGYWAAIHEADADLANTKTVGADSIVETWARTGRAEELLEPLLSDEREEVRYGAAAHLLRLGCAENAVPILESLSANPDGLVAPTARLLLLNWRRTKR
jgi:HEAT repeat protein